MRTIIKIDPSKTPTKITMMVHNAPHRRAHRAVLIAYRKALWEAWRAAGRSDTLDVPIDLYVTFIDPTGPDLDNLLTALFQALDGKTGKGPTILADDRLVSFVQMSILRL
jgi:Holliday junction resolvase RusA-like endonuclease